MSEFTSGEDVLQQARLALSSLGAEYGALIVEGQDDRKLFLRLCHRAQQIVVATGKPLVREAHGSMLDEDRGRFAFLVDCDGDVLAGRLHPDADLVITISADVENDLIEIGALETVVQEFMPGVVDGTVEASAAATELRDQAVRVATPLGHIRRAARAGAIPLSKQLKVWDLDFQRFHTTEDGALLATVLDSVVARARLTSPQRRGIERRLPQFLGEDRACNGHDLVEAIRQLLAYEHGVGKDRVRNLDGLLRAALLDVQRRESWKVVEYLRRWERVNGRKLLKS